MKTKRLIPVILAVIFALLITSTAFAWDGGVATSKNCDGVTVTASPENPYWQVNSGKNQIKWIPDDSKTTGTGFFPWNSTTALSGTVSETWIEYTSGDSGKTWVKTSATHSETFSWSQTRSDACHKYTVTFGPTVDCNSTTLTANVYDYGSLVNTEVIFTHNWTNPWVLETTVASGTYKYKGNDFPYSVPLNEPSSCQVTHKVTYGSDNTCSGWDAWYAIDGGPDVNYANGTWTNPYTLENATVPAFNIPTTAGQLYDNPHKDGFGIKEPANCLVTLKHDAKIDANPDCTGWKASFVSSDGGVATPTTPTSGVWTDPYSLESATVSYSVVWPDGYSTTISATVNEPETCLRSKTSVTVKKGDCTYEKGQDFILTLGEGLTFDVYKQGANVATVTMTTGGSFSLAPGIWIWKVSAAPNYDIVGPSSGTLNVSGSCNPPDVTYIPHVDLFITHQGFGTEPDPQTIYYCILVSSTDGPVSQDIIKSQCLVNQTALPSDFTNPTCTGPITGPSGLTPSQYAMGNWSCDPLLLKLTTSSGYVFAGHRLPLFSPGQRNLWKISQTLLSWLKP